MKLLGFSFLVFLLSSSTGLADVLSRPCFNQVRYNARSIQIEAAAILVNHEQTYQQQMEKFGEATIGVRARTEANGAKKILDAVQTVADGTRLTVEQSLVVANLCKADMNIYSAINGNE